MVSKDNMEKHMKTCPIEFSTDKIDGRGALFQKQNRETRLQNKIRTGSQVAPQ